MTVGIYRMRARDVMTQRADTIRSDETIHAAIEKMVNFDLSVLPVVNRAGECVGVLTKTDIVRLAGYLEHSEEVEPRNETAALFFGVSLDEVTKETVEEVMTKHVISVGEDDPVTTIADIMLKYEIHHVPVCSAQNHVIGVVSSMDLVQAIRAPVPTD